MNVTPLRAGTLALVVESGPSQGRRVALEAAVLTVGSAEVTDLTLAGDTLVARVHAELLRQGADYEIHALAGAALTVNGRAVTTQVVRAGDRVKIGQHTLRVVDGSGVAPADAPSPAPAPAPTDRAARTDTPAATGAVPVLTSQVRAQIRLMPVWLRIYLVLMAMGFLYFGLFAGGSTTALDEVVAAETARGVARHRPVAETSRVVWLLQAAVAYESRGDRDSALELYREVLVARTPPDPTGPASTYAAQQLGLLGTR